MSNFIKVHCCLSGIPLNQERTSEVLLHWLKFFDDLTLLMMRSKSILLIFPISDLAGFISRHVGCDAKLLLWSLSVIKQFFLPFSVFSSRVGRLLLSSWLRYLIFWQRQRQLFYSLVLYVPSEACCSYFC